MPQTKPFKDYYTASEVKKKLGITDGMLYNYVRYGHLTRIRPPGRSQGVYKKEEVDKLALEMRVFLGSKETTKNLVVTTVTINDVADTVKLTGEIFGSEPSLAIRTAWVERNRDVSYQLCADGSTLGVATLLPLKPERIEKILAGEVSSEQTPAEEIEVYEPGKSYHLYAMGVGVSPVLSKLEKRIYGSKLIRGIYEAITELGERGIDIETITGRSHTVDGVRIMRHIGFQQVPSVTRDSNFRIDLHESNAEVARQYREALQRSRQTGTRKK